LARWMGTPPDCGEYGAKRYGKKPSVIASQASCGDAETAFHQRGAGGRHFLAEGVSVVAKEICEVDDGPEEEREVKRLGHSGGLHVEEVGIQSEDGYGGPGGEARCRVGELRITGEVAGKAEDGDHGKSIGHHRWKRSSDTGLPKCAIDDEGHGEEMRKREPDCAELERAGRTRIEDAAGDVYVGDGVAVEEEGAG